jgi:hypothetical protein
MRTSSGRPRSISADALTRGPRGVSHACSSCCFTPPTPSNALPSAMPNSGRGAPPDLDQCRGPPWTPFTQTWSLGSLMPSDLRIRASSASPFAQYQNQQPYINVSGGGSDSQTPVNGPEAAGKKGLAGSVPGEAWWDWRGLTAVHAAHMRGTNSTQVLTASYTAQHLGPFFLLIQKVNSPSWPRESG